MAQRAPIDQAVTDVVAQLEKSTSVDEISACLRDAARQPPLQGFLNVSDYDLVSIDIIGNSGQIMSAMRASSREW